MASTHYRKAFKSAYLASADITEPSVFTISHVTLESDRNKRSDSLFNTAHFVEKELRASQLMKPMVLNVGHCEKLAKHAGSKFIEDWSNIVVTIDVDPNVRFGRDTVEGLRFEIGSTLATDEQISKISKLVADKDADLDGLLRWAGASEMARFPGAKVNEAIRMLESK